MKSSRFLLVVIFAFVLSLTTACTKTTAHDHEYSDWTIVTAPSETAGGVAERVCECGDVDRQFVSALNDTNVWSVEVINPTHLELGATVYTSTFGTISFEIPKLADHEFGDWAITVEPTDAKEGTAVRTCPCEEVEEVTLPVLTDSAVWTVKEDLPADHFNAGHIVYASVYGDVTVVLPVIEHSYGDWTIKVAPTADSIGTAERVCSCNDVESVVLPLPTDTSVWTEIENVAPDHFNKGSITYSSIYGNLTVEVPMIAHSYGDWTITLAPTADAIGTAERVCSCNDVESVELPVLTDTTVWTVAEDVHADHLNEGHILYTSIYGDVNVVLPIDPDHIYGDWTITAEPTLDTVGTAERVCACNDVDSVELPVLTDTAVWNVSAENPADYNKAGDRTYTSIYGDVTITLAKLVAPYDNKTYSNLNYDAELNDFYYKNGVVSPYDGWSIQTVTLDANGAGTGAGYPFQGNVQMSIVDAETGAMKMTVTAVNPDANGNYSVSVYNGFVDFDSAAIVITRSPNSGLNNMLLLSPYGMGLENATSCASAWDDSMAVNYTVNDGVSVNVFIHQERAYFGVSFVDLDGNAISADACYNAPHVRVLDKDGEIIEAFAFNGEKLVISDRYEGTYVGDMGEATVSGYGVMTIAGLNATYEIVADGVLGVYVNGEYYEATISGTTYTATKPMVAITFEEGEYVAVEDVTVNKNIAYVLPTLDCLTHQFKGWYYDANFENPVEVEFIPTSDVTLHALWTEKVVVNLSGVLEGDATVVYLGEGDMIGSALPEYGVELSVMKKFIGWYFDANGETALPEEATVTTADSGITIYALWTDLPVYYGTYKGTEVWGQTSGNGSSYTVAIDENGKISGRYTGIVVDYDPVTQKITWKKSETDTSINGFWFNEELGILAIGYYSTNEIGKDYYIFGKYEDDGKATAQYGIQTSETDGSSSRGYYARLLTMKGPNGDAEIFVYRNRIYSDFVATDMNGNTLTASTVKNSKALVVYDGDGNFICAMSSKGSSFNADSNTVDLDAYFGTYVNGENVIVLDGAGGATLNGVAGTYAVATEGSSYGFDVYLANSTEYYEVTLDGDSFTFNKPMVNITYEEGAYASVEDVSVNKNVAYELPFLTHETNVFNGWFYDAEFTSPVGTTIVPTKDVTLHALWKVKEILTIVYNNGDENATVEYSVGDVVEVEMPVYRKHEFKGWFTTADFAEGTEWVSGTEITEDFTIYAKWVDAEPYYNVYMPIRVVGTSETKTSDKYTYASTIWEVNPDGTGTSNQSNPFGNGAVTISDYVKETGYLKITGVRSSYYGFVDPVTGIIITNYTTSGGLKQVIMYTPFENGKDINSSVSSSYWQTGLYRAIEYTYDGTVYRIFIYGESVYFGVTFEDANGNAVLGVDCYKSATLIVKDANGDKIAKFAHDGTVLQFMDGYEGSYTGENAVTVDGVKTITIDGVEGTYTLVEGAGYTADAYVDGAYYEVTLNKDDYTAVVNKPMVTITYVGGEQADVEALVTNKNIAVDLAQPTHDDFVFRGWYTDETFTERLDDNYMPTVDVTVYAKWDAKVTLTVIYGNGLENAVLVYGIGDMATPAEPIFTNGMVFDGWYVDAELTSAYTVSEMTESLTIYCAWKNAHAMYGNWVGYNVYGGGSGTPSVSGYGSLTVSENGQASGKKSGTLSEVTGNGLVTVNGAYGAVDLDNGVVMFNYGSGASYNADLFIFIKGASYVEVDKPNSCYWAKGATKLVKFKLTDHAQTEMYVFIHDGRIYGNVTFTSSDASVTGGNAYKASDLTVYDSEGNVIATFVKGSTELVVA